MSDADRLRRLGEFLYGFAALMFAGTIVELVAAGHFRTPMEVLPLALCAVGIAAIVRAWTRPSQTTVGALRLTMLVAAGAGLLGVWQHLAGNARAAQEIRPGAAGWDLVGAALVGQAPPLAPAALAATAIVAVAATYADGWTLPFRPRRRRPAGSGSRVVSSRS